MSSSGKRRLPVNSARRHFLGMAAAASARVAVMYAAAMTMVPISPAQAKRKDGWKGRGKKDDHPGRGPSCFLSGTSIMTPTGEVRIEDLQIGDLVETVRGEAMAVKWIGRSFYKRSGPSWNSSVVPIRISRDALDQRTPHADLYLSPYHALLIDGVLIRVKDLVNGSSIAPALPADREMIEYFHIVLDTHEVILAEGVPAETFRLEPNNHESFTNFVEFERLYPGDPRPAMTPFAPIVVCAGGRDHLKALLRLGVRRFIPVRDPIQNAYERIAARAEQLVS